MDENTFRQTIKNMRRRTIHLDREGVYWNKYDLEQLVMMFNEGYGVSEIAVALQRTEWAVIQQAEKMDLYGRKENPQRRKSDQPKAVCLCDLCQLRQTCHEPCKDYIRSQEAD